MTTSAAQVHIDLGDRSYDIAIASGLLDQSSTWQGLPKAAAALIVTNDTVAPLYLARLQHSLSTHYPLVHVCSLPDGEAHKTWDSLNLIFDELLGKACDRKTVLFALGGGVIGDITGFAAACYALQQYRRVGFKIRKNLLAHFLLRCAEYGALSRQGCRKIKSRYDFLKFFEYSAAYESLQ